MDKAHFPEVNKVSRGIQVRVQHIQFALLMPIPEHFVLFSRDEVETRLVTEVQALRDNVSALQEMLSEVCST
jgi:hypothetical protein